MLPELKYLIENDKDLSPYIFDGYHGIRFPKLKQIAKIVAKEKRYDFFDEQHTIFEEYIIHAFAIGFCKENLSFLLEKVKEFIPQINCWSICDTVCQNMKFSRKNQKEVFEFLLNYVDSKNEWESRFVAVTLLSHYLNDEYIDKFFEIIDRLYKETYMSKMGIAWAIATAMAKFPERTFYYLSNNSLDNWTYNKAIQKMIESFRVKEEDKKVLKTMKK